MSTTFGRVVPILCIFDIGKAREFYVDYLGCTIDWEHRFEPKLPLYMQVSRGSLELHLSEHHGDGSPGVRVRIETMGIEDLAKELAARDYGYLRPCLERAPWGELELGLIDPFGNRLSFYQPVEAGA
ncbi:MAG: VOC family protein [Candidatus Eremiobacteraeota bacterium]|nr:VOC family protein [Candidatus Eremiobacteraeota bacterium]